MIVQNSFGEARLKDSRARVKTPRKHKILFALAAALAVSASTVAAAKDWNSGTGGNWSENRNWKGVLNFNQGDSANFPASSFSPAASVVNFDLPPGTDVSGITFAGGSWKIQGNTLDLGVGITNAGNNEVSCLIQIFPGVVFSSSSGQLRLGNVSLLGRTATFSVTAGAKIFRPSSQAPAQRPRSSRPAAARLS
jgi:hypothetical protein